MTGIAKKAVSGLLWNLAEKFATKGVTVITTLLLAWFLTPNDYALIAMLTVFIALSTALVDAGIGQALIRMPDVKDEDLNTAFFINIALSGLIYLLCYIAAPYIATFYDEPLLTSLVRIVTLSLFFQSVIVVPKSLLVKKLNFKAQLKIVLPAAFISSGAAILLAYLKFGVWALIFQMLIMHAVQALCYWIISVWRPKFQLSYSSVKKLAGFSSFVVLDSLFAIPFANMYLIVLPKFFAASLLGYYYFAQKIKGILLDLFIGAIQTVTYPALSQIQQDNARLKTGYRKIVRITTFLVFPLLLFTAAIANLIFDILLPEKWQGAVLYLQLMLVASVLYPLHSINLNILKVKGRADLFFYVGLFKKAVGIIVFVFTIQYDIVTVLIGQIIVSKINYLPNAYYSNKLIGYTLKEQLADFIPALIITSFIAAAVYSMQSKLALTPILELAVLMVFAPLVYLVAGYVTKLKAFTETINLVMRK